MKENFVAAVVRDCEAEALVLHYLLQPYWLTMRQANSDGTERIPILRISVSDALVVATLMERERQTIETALAQCQGRV
jgi:hypothetical protein